jgi:hypothetical protein
MVSQARIVEARSSVLGLRAIWAVVTLRQVAESATLKIERRTWVQDAVRVYKVIVDDAIIGKIGPLQTKTFELVPGTHSIRLAMPTTGRSSSATIPLDMKAGKSYVIRTVRRGGLGSFLKLPFAFPRAPRHWPKIAQSRVVSMKVRGFT